MNDNFSFFIDGDILNIKASSLLKNIFAITLASKEIMRNDIDSIFEKNKALYVDYYRKSDIYKSILTQSINYETEKYTEKVIGIIEYYLDIDNFNGIENLYKKAFRKIYINIKNLETLNVSDIVKYTNNGLGRNIEILSTVYVYLLNDKFILDEEQDLFISKLLIDISHINTYIDINYSDNVINFFKEDLIEISNKLGIKKKTYTLETLITDILIKDVEKYNKSIIATEKANIDTIQKYGAVGKYIGAIEGTFNYLQIDSSRLAENITFTQKEVDRILLNYIYAKKFNSFSDNDMAPIIIQTAYLTALSKEYKNLKKDYLKDVNEEHLLEVDNLQKDLTESKYKYIGLIENTKIKEQYLNIKEKEITVENEKIQKENIKLKKELEDKSKELENLKKELIRLRNLTFNTESKNEDTLETKEDVDIEKLNKLNIVIVGGNINWVKKLKTQVPNWSYIGIEQQNNDFSNLKNSQFIFMNIKMKHSLYFKVKNFISKFNIKYDYLQPSENISMNIEDIYSKLKSESLI